MVQREYCVNYKDEVYVHTPQMAVILLDILSASQLNITVDSLAFIGLTTAGQL